jgi:hypothetical protein
MRFGQGLDVGSVIRQWCPVNDEAARHRPDGLSVANGDYFFLVVAFFVVAAFLTGFDAAFSWWLTRIPSELARLMVGLTVRI